ncbi:c-type cytochrome [Helicobacter cetorum]|uniref:c-type cytochrome n=1 Tax=Helicobacter cetorum TaxID=138563 RepID=UPI000CF12FEA|nr:cytochrome c-553 [Helicobacter cetorum]
MSKVVLTLSILIGLFSEINAKEINPKKVAKEKGCLRCHGKYFETPVGPAKIPTNTLSAERIETSLLDFKSGKKKDALMQMLVEMLSVEEIKVLAKYIPTLKK